MAIEVPATVVVVHRLMHKPRTRHPWSKVEHLSHGDRIQDRDQAIIAAAKANIPMEEVAQRAGMTRWGATLVLRRHGYDFTRMQDMPEALARRTAVEAAMRTAPSLTALARQVGLPVGIATYLARQIDPTWSRRRSAANLESRRRLRSERIERLRMSLICRQMSMSQAGRAISARNRRAAVSTLTITARVAEARATR